jgi:hypothetical protein
MATFAPKVRAVPRAEDRRICAAMPSPAKQSREFDRKARETVAQRQPTRQGRR